MSLIFATINIFIVMFLLVVPDLHQTHPRVVGDGTSIDTHWRMLHWCTSSLQVSHVLLELQRDEKLDEGVADKFFRCHHGVATFYPFNLSCPLVLQIDLDCCSKAWLQFLYPLCQKEKGTSPSKGRSCLGSALLGWLTCPRSSCQKMI